MKKCKRFCVQLVHGERCAFVSWRGARRFNFSARRPPVDVARHRENQYQNIGNGAGNYWNTCTTMLDKGALEVSVVDCSGNRYRKSESFLSRN